MPRTIAASWVSKEPGEHQSGVYTMIRTFDESADVELPEVGGRWRVAELLPRV